jgi:hypothetical protein
MHPKHRILTSSHLDIKASDTTIRFMRTIIQIDDGLHQAAKSIEAAENKTVGQVISGLLALLQHQAHLWCSQYEGISRDRRSPAGFFAAETAALPGVP